jgi:hypothetical protein
VGILAACAFQSSARHEMGHEMMSQFDFVGPSDSVRVGRRQSAVCLVVVVVVCVCVSVSGKGRLELSR